MASRNRHETVATDRFKSEKKSVARETFYSAVQLWLFALAVIVLSWPAIAGDLRFGWPIDCVEGEDCWIVKHVDLKAGPGVSDFACGTLADDGHRGTDIALRGVSRIDEGVSVLAAASGVVKRLRDNMPDIDARFGDPSSVEGRECGNGLLIDHGDGWSTQYCHLKNGSVSLKRGDAVEKGQEIGKVGLSGKTNFPHLHFSVRRNGGFVDPFSGRERGMGCHGENRPMWDKSLAATLHYRPAVILDAGFAIQTPSAESIARNRPKDVLLSDSDTIYFWVDAFGLKVGDKLEFEIVAPGGGERKVTRTATIPTDDLRRFPYVSWRKIFERWRPGKYVGSAKIIRGLDKKKTLSTIRATAVMN